MKQWKKSGALKNILILVLVLSVFADVIAGMSMAAGGEYASVGREKPADFFVAGEETNLLLDGYIRLFEEYMQIGSLITEDGDIDYDKEILVSLLDDKSYTIKELLKISDSEGEAVENLRDFMEDFAKNCEEGKSYPWYTRQALQSYTRVILEGDNIFQFQNPNATFLSRKKIADMAEHQKNMVAISTTTQKYKERLGESVSLTLPAENGKKITFYPKSSYEGYIIEYFPEYARWYFLNRLVKSYENQGDSSGLEVFRKAYETFCKGEGWEDVSEKIFYEMIQKRVEEYNSMLSPGQIPWSVHVIPRTIDEAGKYVTFLVETYQELKYLFSHSNFVFAYENSKDLLITNHESIWQQIKEESGKETPQRKAADTDSYLYAYFDNRGDEGKTNFVQESFGMSGNVFERLRNIGNGFRAGSYQIAVGLDLQGVRSHRQEDEFLNQYLVSNERLKMYVWGKTGLMVSGIFTLISFVLLALMCGYNRETGEYELGLYDCVWLEIQLAAVYIFGEMILWLLALWNQSTVYSLIFVFGIVVFLLCLLILGIVFSVIKKQKQHLLVRYSLILLFVSEVLCRRMRIREWAKLMRRRFTFLPARQKYTFLFAFEAGSILYATGCLIFVKTDRKVTVSSFFASPFGIAAIMLALIFLIMLLLWQRGAYQGEKAERMIIEGTRKILEGDFAYQLPDAAEAGERKVELVDTINQIGEVLERAVEESVRNERLKAELIANVSHDIKTPLTSVINYVDLIKRQQVDNETVRKYIAILERKSLRLKTLIEDLVEASKASSGVMELEIHTLNFNELVRQTNGEFDDRFEECHLELVVEIPEEKLYFRGDGRRVFRILENLYNNTAKYAMEHTRVYVSLKREGENLVFSMKNVSASKLNITPEELTERFVRGDRSRTTEGSGLGLSIAKSLTELMEGRFVIELDGDLFCAKVYFPELEKEE